MDKLKMHSLDGVKQKIEKISKLFLIASWRL